MVLIDQSGSMSGQAGAPASDPQGLRITAVSELAALLGAYGATSDVRFGVIDFGSTSSASPVLTVPLTQMNVATAESNVIPRIKSVNLGATEFRSPLCLAWQVLSGANLPPGVQCDIPPSEQAKVPLAAPSKDRRKLVVLITDGAPARGFQEYAFSGGDPADCSSLAGSEGHQYMCGLDAMWTRLNQVQPVELSVIGLDVNNQWWPTVERYWRLIARCDGPCAQARVTRNPSALKDLVEKPVVETARSFSDLCPISLASPTHANACTIEPGLLEARFSIVTTGGEIRLTGPNNAPPAPEVTNRIKLANREIWIVQFPEAGEWHAESNDPQASLSVEVLKTAANLKFATSPVTPLAGEDFEVRAQVLNRDGKGVVRIPEQAASFEVTLSISQGGKVIETRPLKSIADRSQDFYRFDKPFRLAAPGDYELSGLLKAGANAFASGTTAVKVIAPPPPTLRVESLDAKPETVNWHVAKVCCPMQIASLGEVDFRITLGNPAIEQEPYRLSRWLKTPDGVKGVLRISLEDCEAPALCELQPEFTFPPNLGETEVHVKLPPGWRDSGKITTEALLSVLYLDGGPGQVKSDTATLAIERPPWDSAWQDAKAGYLAPLLIVLVVLGAVSMADVRLGRPLGPEYSYSRMAVWRSSSVADYQGLVRLGGLMIWRRFPYTNSARAVIVARALLIAGPLTIRGGTASEEDDGASAPSGDEFLAQSPFAGASDQFRGWFLALRGYLFGTPGRGGGGEALEFTDPPASDDDAIVVGPNPDLPY